LLAPFALAAIFLYVPAQTPAIRPSQVFTWDCEYPEQRPTAITLTCADGGMYIDEIDWSRWDSKGAQGMGVYHVNDCDPTCAEGKFLHAQVKVKLSKLEEHEGKFFLRTLEIRSPDGENIPRRSSNSLEWDVMEFAEMMGKSK
jgi:hypothetical protein